VFFFVKFEDIANVTTVKSATISNKIEIVRLAALSLHSLKRVVKDKI
jgi:hypothetical protein